MTDGLRLLPDPCACLESAFSAIYAERMGGLAFVNPAIRVEAVAFAPWKGYWLGVMLTPWSMNLLLAPRDPAAWRPLPQGEKLQFSFPAGNFDFVSAHSDALGEYLVCSLFSPLLEFADHETAREAALVARAALLDAANAESPQEPTGNLSPRPLAELQARLDTPLSRRDLLHGRLAGGRDASGR
jgi:[NiFe] hydrogenase assembly HybE family chaperone